VARAQDVGWAKLEAALRQHRAKGPGVEKFKAMDLQRGRAALPCTPQGGDFLEATHLPRTR